MNEDEEGCALEETAAGLTFYTDRKMIVWRDAGV